MLKISLIGIGSIVLITSALFSFQAGVFDSIHFFEEMRGPYFLTYKEYNGSYTAVGYNIKSVYEKVKKEKKSDIIRGGFAVFYDNPQNSRSNNLRSICGVITDTLITIEPPYKSAVYKKSYCIVGKYPLRSLFSYMSGLYKFYPALEKYTKAKKVIVTGPVMELIDTKSKVIIFIVSVNTPSSVPLFAK